MIGRRDESAIPVGRLRRRAASGAGP